MDKLKLPESDACQKMLYFDNNSTTKMDKETIKFITSYMLNCSNINSSHTLANEHKKLLDNCRKFILQHLNVTKQLLKDSLDCDVFDNGYYVIFTGSACESNNFVIQSAVNAYSFVYPNRTPHVIVSSIEHKTTIELCKELKRTGRADITFVEPNVFGAVTSKKIEDALTPNTCIVSIMHANNEVGTINDIYKISELLTNKNIPFHSDCVQTFGKYKIKLIDYKKEDNNEIKYQINAISASSHKFYGPQGIGILILDKEFVYGYDLKPLIFGSQQYNLRGGTENIPQIFGAVNALYRSFYDDSNSNLDDIEKAENGLFKNCIPVLSNTPIRKQKNSHLLFLSQYFIKLVKEQGEAILDFVNYSTYLHSKGAVPYNKFYNLIVLGVEDMEKINRWEMNLPNTILLAILSNNKEICNVKLKNELEHHKIIVSIGSACNTKSKFASHVIDAIKGDNNIKKGVIRISFGDYNTKKEVEVFAKTFIKCLSEIF